MTYYICALSRDQSETSQSVTAPKQTASIIEHASKTLLFGILGALTSTVLSGLTDEHETRTHGSAVSEVGPKKNGRSGTVGQRTLPLYHLVSSTFSRQHTDRELIERQTTDSNSERFTSSE